MEKLVAQCSGPNPGNGPGAMGSPSYWCSYGLDTHGRILGPIIPWSPISKSNMGACRANLADWDLLEEMKKKRYKVYVVVVL